MKIPIRWVSIKTGEKKGPGPQGVVRRPVEQKAIANVIRAQK